MSRFMNLFIRFTLIALVCLAVDPAYAEEKNGLMLTAAKKTLDRSQSRTYYSRTTEKTQALKVTVKNISIRPIPEVTLQWTVLARPYYGSKSLKYTGTEPMKSLKPAEVFETLVPLPQVVEYRGSDTRKDDTEYQLLVMNGEEEMVRLETTKEFDFLAKAAVLDKSRSYFGEDTTGLKIKKKADGTDEEATAEGEEGEMKTAEKPMAEPVAKVEEKPVVVEQAPVPTVDFFNLQAK